MCIQRNDQAGRTSPPSTRRGRSRPCESSSGEKDSAACRRCPPQDAERSSRRPAAVEGAHRRPGAGPFPGPAARTSRALLQCPTLTSRHQPEKRPRSSQLRAASAAGSPAARPGRGRGSSGARAVRADHDRGAASNPRTNAAGCGPIAAQQRLDRLDHAGHAAERQRRRAESDHLAIVAIGISTDDVNRIGRRIDVIEGAIEVVQACSRVSRPRSCACHAGCRDSVP